MTPVATAPVVAAPAAPSLPRLKSVDNLRDLAGPDGAYPTPSGRLRRGVLYRSNRLNLTPTDHDVVNSLGLTAIRDLREPNEVKKFPNTPIAGATWVHHPVPGLPDEVIPKLMTAAQTYDAMVVNYQTFVSDPECRAGLGDLLRGIAATDGPQLFHCSAGKDRTGWAAVLLHRIAGVSDSDIITDYLLTDKYAVTSKKATLDSIVENLGAHRAPAYGPAFVCDTRYLDAAFAEADRLYGGVDGYLTDGLALTADEIETLRIRITDED